MAYPQTSATNKRGIDELLSKISFTGDLVTDGCRQMIEDLIRSGPDHGKRMTDNSMSVRRLRELCRSFSIKRFRSRVQLKPIRALITLLSEGTHFTQWLRAQNPSHPNVYEAAFASIVK